MGIELLCDADGVAGWIQPVKRAWAYNEERIMKVYNIIIFSCFPPPLFFLFPLTDFMPLRLVHKIEMPEI